MNNSDSVITICITLLIILKIGEPDLLTVIIQWIMK